MIHFRVVTVTNNLDRYGQHWDHTAEFPLLTVDMLDEVETFIVDTRDGGFWKADEFFASTNIENFFVDSSEAPE
jgi:hypothetical protein